MKIYQVTLHDPHEGTCYAWAGSKRAGEKMLAAMKRDMECDGSGEVEQIDMPTDKQNLIGWLNRNFTRDNG